MILTDSINTVPVYFRFNQVSPDFLAHLIHQKPSHTAAPFSSSPLPISCVATADSILLDTMRADLATGHSKCAQTSTG